MDTNAKIAARFLRHAATFCRRAGGSDSGACHRERMEANAHIYERLADAVEREPHGAGVFSPRQGGRRRHAKRPAAWAAKAVSRVPVLRTKKPIF